MFKINIEDYKNNFVILDSLFIDKVEDVITILKKLNNDFLEDWREKDIIKYETISFTLNDIYGISIEKIKPFVINNFKAYSMERGDNLFLIFPKDAVLLNKKLNSFVKKTNKKLENSDNFRIAKFNDELSMKEYEDLYSCCGYYFETQIINETKYIFGCNYGH